VVTRNHTETAFVLMLISIFVGTVIDDLGIRIENQWLDRRREQRTSGSHSKEWWAYLCKTFDVEPSGRRHLRKLVVRLKFELGVPIGLVLALPAVWLNVSMLYRWSALTTMLGGVLGAYLFSEAAATHEVLGMLRHELVKGEYAVATAIRPKSTQSSLKL
jgi:hypothetical protein